MMRNYIFLDSWVLSRNLENDGVQHLSRFILENNYTVLINSTILVETFNIGWRNAQGEERMQRIARFLSQHPCEIIYPDKVYSAEIEAFPNSLNELPIDLNLSDIPAHLRETVLLRFFQEDSSFLEQGKGIKQWFENLNALKAQWLDDVGVIIEDACQKDVLRRDGNGRFIELPQRKEQFLIYLDRRHFTTDHIRQADRETINLFLNGTSKLPAIRMSSLCFWYSYVEEDKSFPMKKNGSDIADFYQISLIPYCSVFTVDNNMFRMTKRILADIDYTCEVLSPGMLADKLASL